MNIYVGNLPSDVTEDELRELFEGFAQVESANVVKDRFTGQARGFGFVDDVVSYSKYSDIYGCPDD